MLRLAFFSLAVARLEGKRYFPLVLKRTLSKEVNNKEYFLETKKSSFEN